MYYETDLFDHSSYGEAFIGMAKHVTDMTMLERQIFEDCSIPGGHPKSPTCGHLKIPHPLVDFSV